MFMPIRPVVALAIAAFAVILAIGRIFDSSNYLTAKHPEISAYAI